MPENHAPHPGTAITCGGCTATWTGRIKAHCGACHRTFSGVSAFDLHRRLAGRHGSCVDPATMTRGNGEPVLDHRTGVWGQPGMDAETVARRRGGAW